jgi:hypothetical protein
LLASTSGVVRELSHEQRAPPGCSGDESSRAGQVVVPDLVGLPQPDAQKKLERLGFDGDSAAVIVSSARRHRPVPNVSFAPDPYADEVVSQQTNAGERVQPRAIVVFETECTMLRFKNSGCI